MLKASRAQVEVVVQLFVGVYTDDMVYIDDWRAVAARTAMSVSGFWFDCATSIPWSYLDLVAYQARPAASCVPCFLSGVAGSFPDSFPHMLACSLVVSRRHLHSRQGQAYLPGLASFGFSEALLPPLPAGRAASRSGRRRRRPTTTRTTA